MYTDSRCTKIEANLGRALAVYADRNLAGWVLDMLADDRLDDEQGVLRVCDRFVCKHPHLLALVGAA